MAENPFGHIDLRVSSMTKAQPFYESLLPALGFTQTRHDPEWKVYSTEGGFPSVAYFGITEDPSHRANHNRIAFWVGRREEVDRIGETVRAAGGTSVSGPKLCPEYSSTYYAVFFEDPCGNRLEVCFRTN